jgi:hypothetical protein
LCHHLLPHDLAGPGWKVGLVVTEVVPPPLPLGVVGGHRAGDVELPARLPQRDRHAAGAHRAARLRLRRGECMQLRTEEVNPEIPVHWDPQESLAHADERGLLRDCVRRKVVQLHAVVEAQPAQEGARRRCEAVLVEADEADDVAERRVGLPVPHRQVNPRRGLPVLVRCQLVGIHQLAQGQPRRRRARPRQRVDHGDGLRGSHAGRRRNAGRRGKR